MLVQYPLLSYNSKRIISSKHRSGFVLIHCGVFFFPDFEEEVEVLIVVFPAVNIF